MNITEATRHAYLAQLEIVRAARSLQTGLALDDTSNLAPALAEQIENARGMLKAAQACVEQAGRILSR